MGVMGMWKKTTEEEEGEQERDRDKKGMGK